MKLLRVLKRESPLLLAREALWRAQRAWNKKLLPVRLRCVGTFKFRVVPYYKPDLRSFSRQNRALIVAFADEICAGRYPFLGYSTAELGLPPKWNVDFVCGAEWPLQRYEGPDCVRCDGSDVKVPYELSRLQFLPILGKAHLLTREESYRSTAKELLSHWIEANPVPAGVNWTLAMEAALRAMSICFLMNLLAPLRSEERPWLEMVSRSLAQHLLYIEANLEFSHLLTSNHYLSDIVGLYCLSLFLEGMGMPGRRQEYRRRIEAEMAKQVYDDGGDYEGSLGYQVLVTQLFVTALLLMRTERRAPVDPAFVERLRKMFRVLNTVASSSGELPHVGDCDDGRTEFLVDDLKQMLLFPVAERNSLRISHLLGLGQRLFGEGQGDISDAAWYGLTESAATPYSKPLANAVPVRPVQLLPRTGIGVLKHRSAELLFFAIPNGIFGKGSHNHNDKLSFVLRLGGQEVFCDSGTGCYTRDITMRNRFRSTAAHNTLLLDGTEQNRIFPGPRGLFIIGNEASVTPVQEGKDERGLFLRASHTGYRSLGVVHTRTIRTVDGESAFTVEDELAGEGAHDLELNFQLAPNRTAEIVPIENGILGRIHGDPEVQLTVTGPASLQGAVQPSVISTTFGAVIPAMKVRVCGRAAVPVRIATRISWVPSTKIGNGPIDTARRNEFFDPVSEKVH